MANQKFDFNTPLGIAGGLWAGNMLDNENMPQFIQDLNPQMKAAALVFLGSWLPKQKFAKNAVKSAELRDGVGAGITASGVQTLLEEFGFAGVGATGQLRDDDILAVAIEGDYDDDIAVVNADEYDDEEYEDDIDVINADVLAEDVLSEDWSDDDDDDDMYY